MLTTSEIEKRASELLAKHAQHAAPIDVVRMIESESINLVIDDMDDDHSGFLLVENGAATIAVNSEHHLNRQRFTAAHELGHYVLHSQGRDRFFVDKAYFRGPSASAGTETQEIEANRFAACLLMPAELLKDYASRTRLTDLEVYRLSTAFQVSEQAMTLRLANLGLIEA